jgi:3-hydroxy-9,10-secoandrosta-1,3,5(10)-triene-9,17-dione monooxygenase
MSASSRVATPVAPPEPGLTARQLIARAAALRPLLAAQQEESARLTRPSPAVHQACMDAGIYRLYVPRRYGGYEFDPVTYVRVCIELARGDMSAAWGVMLAAAHALQVGGWFPERAQEEIFGDGDFRCASVAAPALARPVEGGWELTGKVTYASGIPLSTHYFGQFAVADADGRPTERMLMFVARDGQYEILDDWGRLMGLKASGSNAVAFDRARVPAHWAIEGLMVDYDVSDPVPPGVALHGNPMYGGRAMGPFTLTLTALGVGAAYQALDIYEQLLEQKLTPLPPFEPRRGDETYQRWFGQALARIATAEAAVIGAAEQHLEHCRLLVEEGVPFTYGDDWRISTIGREAFAQVYEVVHELLRTAGSSAAVTGSRLERLMNDMAMLHSHRNMVMREFAYGEVAREYLGLPRNRAVQNVQNPR